MAKADNTKVERKYTEGIVAMTAGLACAILGATILDPPKWTAAIFIGLGVGAYITGLGWYKSSREQKV